MSHFTPTLPLTHLEKSSRIEDLELEKFTGELIMRKYYE